ncbi:helix-turn-helix transcriptional regulator [Kutzneria sp. 744]|uniref:helix-turn-helix transcriptional regulator n=1 Tax=Kutzneria sp. (strain 744) TaxID=345341 RepID=UPI0003EED05D|nr:helix-turn-helix transcriptional regulator [Kutzneria sp. 744]EWM12558.1 DNA-binding protein [Kutzneria sp. 744]
MPKEELARFLKDRRAGLRPTDVGLVAAGRRRTPGLRREEVADLAAMSVDYYARLEQARGPKPSPRILDALADALKLPEAERRHLFRLADTVPAPPPGPPGQVRPHLADLLKRLPEAGAVVTDATYRIIAWNPLAEALLGDLRSEPNLARRRFLHPDLQRTSHAEEFGEIAVARLRGSAARYPGDPRLTSLLADLRASEEFVSIWNTNPVRTPGHRSKTVEHPVFGPLRVNCDVLVVPDDDQQVVFMTADPGTATARLFRRLPGS